jgi:hypothetical protein
VTTFTFRFYGLCGYFPCPSVVDRSFLQLLTTAEGFLFGSLRPTQALSNERSNHTLNPTAGGGLGADFVHTLARRGLT